MDTPELTPPRLPDEKRRNLVRGGLAAPIVLGTLASKQALGGSAHYGCSVSGKWSGGSTHGSDKPDCQIGDSCEQIKSDCRDEGGNWVGIKGKCDRKDGDKVWRDDNNDRNKEKCGLTMSKIGFKNHGCYRKYTERSGGYNGGQSGGHRGDHSGGSSGESSGHWEMRSSKTWGGDEKEMTCYEALYLDDTCDDPKGSEHADLCREAVCAYYNAKKYGDRYPCNPTQVVGMVNDCLQFGRVHLSKHFGVSDTTAYWTTQECIDFFKGSRNT